MIPLFDAFGFSVETDENGAIIGDNQAYTINGDGLLYVTDSNPSMPILDDDGAYIIDVLIEKAPFWMAQQELPPEHSNFITDRINNICIDKGFPELVIPLNYDSTFFNSIKNNEIIIIDYKTGQNNKEQLENYKQIIENQVDKKYTVKTQFINIKFT